MISRRAVLKGMLGGSAFCLGLPFSRADAERQRHRARRGRGPAHALRPLLLGQRPALELAPPGHAPTRLARVTHDLPDSLDRHLHADDRRATAGRSPTR